MFYILCLELIYLRSKGSLMQFIINSRILSLVKSIDIGQKELESMASQITNRLQRSRDSLLVISLIP